MRRIYSHSKRAVLEKCPRQYFYLYYAPRCKPVMRAQRQLFGEEPSHTTLVADEISLASELQALTAVPLHAGQILHDLIALALRHPDWRQGWFLQKAEERFGKEDGAAVRFVEHYNELSDADARVQRGRERLNAALIRFFEDEGVRGLVAEMLAGQEILVECRLGGLPSIRNFAIAGKIDFCSRVGAGVDVVDWKMGKSGGDEDSLQLALYGIWASKRYSVSPDKVRIRRVFLGDGKIEQARKLGERLMTRAQARLSQDVEEMAFLHPYGQAGHVEAFTPRPKEKVCEMCIFRKLCPASACMTQ